MNVTSPVVIREGEWRRENCVRERWTSSTFRASGRVFSLIVLLYVPPATAFFISTGFPFLACGLDWTGLDWTGRLDDICRGRGLLTHVASFCECPVCQNSACFFFLPFPSLPFPSAFFVCCNIGQPFVARGRVATNIS